MVNIGVDIGGTKIACGVCVPVENFGEKSIEVKHKTVIPTRKGNVMADLLACIESLVASAGEPPRSIGIGAPGVIDPETGIVESVGETMPKWAGTNIAAEVRAVYPDARIAVHNDVRVMGLGEALYGAGRDWNSSLFVSIGTGIGGAIIRAGKLQDSPRHTAGELRGLICRAPSGEGEIIEDVASGPALARHYCREAGEAGLDFRDVMIRYDQQETLAMRIVDSHLQALGRAISGFASAVDIDAVIIGGGVGNIGAPILEPFVAGFRAGGVAPTNQIPVVQSSLGTSGPIIGAAAYGRGDALC
ncbi:ROK family protein [Corynebacterium falsenii]|uniref:ROK family protein n=1 Tax=Corynebacterium falsenii TaxID=108486 RepID=UPI003FCF98C1